MFFNSTKEKFIFYEIPAFLFSILPFLFITGPFFTDVSASLIGIIFVIFCIKKNNFSFFKNFYFYIFLFFWCYLLLNSLFNNFNLDSLKISFFYIRFGIFIIAVIALLDVDHKFLKNFFYCTFFCFLVLIIDGFFQYFNGENIIGFKSPVKNRVSSFFGDEMILGSYLSRMWPIFFGLSIFFLKKKNIKFYLFILIFILSETLVFLSGERVAFFYLNLSAIFIILLSSKLYKLRLITLISSIIIILFLSFFFPAAKERVVDQTLNQMNITTDNKNGNIYIFSKQHTHHYLSAYRMFLENKILGVGVKNFRNYCNEEKYKVSNLSCSTHPHNIYIQMLSETGIIGFSFLMLIFLFFSKKIFQHLFLRLKGKKLFNDFEICLLAGILLFLWPIVPTGNVFNNWLNIMFILNIAPLIWSIKKEREIDFEN